MNTSECESHPRLLSRRLSLFLVVLVLAVFTSAEASPRMPALVLNSAAPHASIPSRWDGVKDYSGTGNLEHLLPTGTLDQTSPPCAPIRPAQTVNSPSDLRLVSFVDLLQAQTVLTSQGLATTLTLRDVPAQVRKDALIGLGLSVYIDADDNVLTGYDGYDASRGAEYVVFAGAKNVTATLPLENLLEVSVYKANSSSFERISEGALSVDAVSNQLILLGAVPDMSSTSRVVYFTGYNNYRTEQFSSDAIECVDPLSRPPRGNVFQSLQNEHLRIDVDRDGQFVIGTTGGSPASADDNNKRIMFGFSPEGTSGIWSSFITLRLIQGSTVTDVELRNRAPSLRPRLEAGSLVTEWEVAPQVIARQTLALSVNSLTGQSDVVDMKVEVRNTSTTTYQIGVRFLIDVMLGSNDGAPYFILGSGRVTQEFEWGGDQIPEYWVAYESPTFAANSLTSYGQLRQGEALAPNHFTIASWPRAYFDSTWDYQTDNTQSITTDSAVLLTYQPVTTAPGGSRVARSYYGLARSGQEGAVELTDLEVTQGIQNLTQNVALIEGRRTLLRAYVQTTFGSLRGVQAELIARRDGQQLGAPLLPRNPGADIDVDTIGMREHINDSFFFQLPDDWLQGTVEFEIRGRERQIACKDSQGTSNDCKVAVTFQSMPALDVRLVPMVWEQDGIEHKPSVEELDAVVEELRAALPVDHINVDSPYTIKPTFFAGKPTEQVQFTRMALMLSIQRQLDGCNSIPFAGGCRRLYIGVLDDFMIGLPTNGRVVVGVAAGIGGDAVVGYHDSFLTLPHEVGHAAGRYHVKCDGSEGGPDSSYPYRNGWISDAQTGDKAFYGVDTRPLPPGGYPVVYPPSVGDLMSYCERTWISPYTYQAIHKEFSTRFAGTNAAPDVTQLAATPAMVVGLIFSPQQGRWSLGPMYQSELVVPPAPAQGPYQIRLEDVGGQALVSYPFDPGPVDSDAGGAFALTIPWQAATRRVVLLQGNTPLETRVATANAPTVRVVAPNGGELLAGQQAMISWVASDADGDSLSYAVQYSADDGQNWTTLISDWRTTSLDFNPSLLRGSSSARVRVLVSDGFFAAEDRSDSVFRLERHAPQVFIAEPVANARYSGEQTLSLRGRATDTEDGNLSGAALAWSSDLSGSLGTGEVLNFSAANLAVGTHTITLMAHDSDGQSNISSVRIQVARTAAPLPPTLVVAPLSLQFVVAPGAVQSTSQLLGIRNGGDGDFNWTASVDQQWLRISALSGSARTNILLTVDASNLSVGSYKAMVSLIANGVAQGRQEIPVTVLVTEAARPKLYLPLLRR